MLGGAEDGDPPVARVRELDEALEELAVPRRRADRIARDDGHAADDLVRKERALVVGEEVRLVGAEDEGRERVHPPRRDERPRDLALPRLLPEAVPPRRKPRREEPRRSREGDEEDR